MAASTEPGPQPHIIRAWREAAELTQTEAGALVYVTEQTWASWESGRRAMPLGLFELFCLKAEKLDGNP